MPLLANNVLTLVDAAKRVDPDGKAPQIAELLAQTNEILQDMPFMEGNLPTGHRTTVRTGLPTVTWRLLNKGVQPSKSTTAQIDEATGMLEAWSEVDVELAKLNGNTAEFRLSEAQAFIEAMNIEMARTLFYGNSSVDPEQFTGLAPRYSSLSAPNGKNIINAGSSGSDNTSIWLIVWGPNTVHGIYPKGSMAGLDHQDLGEETAETVAGLGGTRMRVYRDKWMWKCGIALRDWRYVVRIANVGIADLIAANSSIKITQLMIRAIHRIHNLKMGTPIFYMNRSVIQALDIQRLSSLQSGGGITYQSVDGEEVESFRGIPIRTTDALLETESVVVA